MAFSLPADDTRSRLIRELSGSRSRSSKASSINSDHRLVNDLDTFSQQLPSLPSELPNTSPGAPRDQDFQINTSALRRAFPDFSQYGSSEEDSIEIGRGINKSVRSKLGDLSEEITQDYPFSLDDEHFQITGTPPFDKRKLSDLPAKQSTTKKEQYGKRLSSHKENLDPLAKLTDYVSGKSSKGSHNSRQPRVDSDDSLSGMENRPVQVNLSAKNSRFSNSTRKPADNALKTITNSLPAANPRTDNLLQSTGRTPRNALSQVSAGNVTNQSFLLPDMPDITALMTGVREDGTPVFPRSAKSKSRFSTPSQRRAEKTKPVSHAPIGDVPISTEDKALYLSLQLLQEKVLRLEAESAKSEQKIEEYEIEVLTLQSKVEELETSKNYDSGLGDNQEERLESWFSEKPKLELSVKSLKDRLEKANRKISQSEATTKTVAKDRDMAQQQLVVAQSEYDDLKNESRSLHREIEHIKNQMADITKRHERTIDHLMAQEDELKQKIQRRERAIKEMSQLSRDIWTTRTAINNSAFHATGDTNRAARLARLDSSLPTSQGIKSERHKPSVSGPMDGPMPNILRRTSSSMTQVHYPQNSLAAQTQEEDDGRQVDSELDNDSGSDVSDNKVDTCQRQESVDLLKDSTYLSFMDGDEIPKLRQILKDEKEKLELANGQTRPQSPTKDTQLPRKSSLKNMSSLPRRNRVQYEEEASAKPSENQKLNGQPNKDTVVMESHDTQASVVSRNSERRRRHQDENADMTSAFIIPDVTIHSTLAQADSGTPSQMPASVKHTVTVQRPVPVSDRVVPTGMHEEDPTMRPAQPPAVALAVVLRGLENELECLRKDLTYQENLYNKHDPALSKRKRKTVFGKIQELLRAIETRADQIYALYDVLEGQKASGHLMDEEQIEVTLQNIGVSSTGAQLGRGPRDDSESGSDSDNDDEDEQTWDGIEATNTQTLGSLRGLGMMMK